MNVISKYARGAAVGVAVFLLFGAAVGLAGAQRPDRPPEPDADAPTERARGPFAGLRGEFLTRLAENLGVPEDALRAAFRQTLEEMRPQIEEQTGQMRERMRGMREHMRDRVRDRMQEHMQDEGRPFGDMAPGPGRRGPGFAEPGLAIGPAVPPQAVVGLAADTLGLDPGELMEHLRAGRTLAEIAAERGVSSDALADQLTGRMEQMRMERTREGIKRMIERPLGAPGRDRRPETE